MADRITINFTANTREVERGADRIDDSLTDVEKALEDVGKEGERSLDKATGASDDLGDSVEGVDGKLDGLGNTAKDALEGDVAGAARGAGEAISGLGPIGLAAGTAIVAGTEIVKGVFDANAAAAEAMAEATSNAFARMVEAGGNYYTKAIADKQIYDTLSDPDKLADILKIVEQTGLAESEVTRAVALSGVERQNTLNKLNDIYAANILLTTQGYLTEQQLADQNGAITEQIAMLQGRNAEDKAGADLLSIYDAATGGVLAKRETEHELIQKRNKALAETPTTITTTLTLDTSEADKQLTNLFAKPRYVKTSAVDRNGKPII